jgi:nuclear receptor subfamily 5 group A protein 3
MLIIFFKAVRADRMRGGRNKFGPMYKRDRARKLQILRQRQLALQALRGSIGGSSAGTPGLSEGAQSQLSPTSYSPYTNMHIKQEIQIPQVIL